MTYSTIKVPVGNVGTKHQRKDTNLTAIPEVEIKLAVLSVLSDSLKKGALDPTEYYDLCECMYQWIVKNKDAPNLRSVN